MSREPRGSGHSHSPEPTYSQMEAGSPAFRESPAGGLGLRLAQSIVDTVPIPMLVLDDRLHVSSGNASFYEAFRANPADSMGRPLTELGNGQWDIPQLRRLLDEVVPEDKAFAGYEIEQDFEEVGRRVLLLNGRKIQEFDLILLAIEDITEQKRQERALRSAMEQAEKTLDTVREPMLVLGDDLRVRRANDAFYKDFRVRPEETEGRLVYELGDGQWEIPRLRELLENVLPHDHGFRDHRVEHEFPDIGRRAMLLNARRIDHVQLILLAIEDVTERERDHEALRQSEARLDRVIHQVPLGIGLLDQQGRWVMGNLALRELIPGGVLPSLDPDGIAPWHTWDADGRPVPPSEWPGSRALRGEATSSGIDFLHTREDGMQRWIRVSAAPYRVLHNEIAGAVVVCQDITEGKQAQEAVRESERRAANEAEAVSRLNELTSGLWRAHGQQECLDQILKATMELLGADRGNIQLLEGSVLRIAAYRGFPQAFLDYFHQVGADDDSACGRALRSGEAVVIEDVEVDEPYEPMRPIARAASFRAVVSVPIVSHNGEPLGMVSAHFRSPHRPSEREMAHLHFYVREAAEVIERERAGEALRESEQRLQEALAIKDDFLALVSHELRTPLTTITGFAGHLRHRFDMMDAETRRDVVEHLYQDSLRLQVLIENLLILTQLERTPIDLEPVLLHRVLPTAVAAARERRVFRRIQLDLPDHLPIVNAQPSWVGLVVRNLISNADKYSPEDEPIDVQAEASDGEVIVRVLDRGSGVSEEDRERLFEPFFRSSKTSMLVPGAGLGLSVCQRLVDLHAGTIAYRPRPGGGSIFEFTLPLIEVGDA